MTSQPGLDTIVSLCKQRGFVYQTSEVYGGLLSSYDYGPLGAQLLKNIKDLWWKTFIESRADMLGLDSQILLHPKTWQASGHVASFNDPLVEDVVNHKRYRADHMIEAWLKREESMGHQHQIVVEDLNLKQLGEIIAQHNIKSPDNNALSAPKQFNLLFETSIGSLAEDKTRVYLRGETAQGIFSDFKAILNSNRVKLPFGVGQMGKSFRNELTSGQFIFRTLEMEQAEIEYFFDPEVNDWQKLLDNWKQDMWQFVTQTLGVKPENLTWRRHTDSERSFYSKDTYDLDYKFPFGQKELWGIAYRTDYDLKQHQQFSGQDLTYTDPNSGKKFIPHVIEPALGLNRALLMVLCDGYHQTDDGRVVLGLTPHLAPHLAAVFPLLKNKPDLVALAQKIHQQLLKKFRVDYDERGNIGKRYFAQDETGTPCCITVDFDSLNDQTVTVRDRDSAQQKRLPISKLESYLQAMID